MKTVIELIYRLIHYGMVPGIMLLIVPGKRRRGAPLFFGLELGLIVFGAAVGAEILDVYSFTDRTGAAGLVRELLPHYWLGFLILTAVLLTAVHNISWVVGEFCFLVSYCTSDLFTGILYLILGYFELGEVGNFLLRILLAGLLTSMSCLIFRKHMVEQNIRILEKKHKITVVILLVVIVILFQLNISSGFASAAYVQAVPEYFSQTLLLTKLSDVMTRYIILRSAAECTIVLFTLRTLLQYNQADIEHELFLSLYEQEKNQYRQFQQNVDYINARYHDLKHCLTLLSKDRSGAERLLEQLGDHIAFLETEIDTGNDMLNNVITDRQMLCHNKKIEFHFMTDGTDFTWMDNLDLYIIFCNILDNAIEYLETHDGERIIELGIRTVRQMVFIHQENGLKESLAMDGKYPISTKGEAHDHGFGIKSIAATIEKYGGSVNISADNGKFELNIFMPKPER